jgi:hypothetical protein
MRHLKLISYVFSPVVAALVTTGLLAHRGIGSKLVWAMILIAGLFVSIVNSIIVVIFIIKK